MKEIKLKEIKPGMVIHCKTEEEAELFYKWLKEKENITDIEKIELRKGIMNAFKNNYCLKKEERLCRVVVNWGDEAVEFSDLILPETMTEEEAYKKGREDAFEEVRNCEAYGYDCGLKDAWELARKLAKCSPKELDEMYFSGLTHAVVEHTYHEALAKVEDYEKKIKVGDVISLRGVEAVVTCIYPDGTFDGIKITADDKHGRLGGVYAGYPLSSWEKTGNHRDLSAILIEIGKE